MPCLFAGYLDSNICCQNSRANTSQIQEIRMGQSPISCDVTEDRLLCKAHLQTFFDLRFLKFEVVNFHDICIKTCIFSNFSSATGVFFSPPTAFKYDCSNNAVDGTGANFICKENN